MRYAEMSDPSLARVQKSARNRCRAHANGSHGGSAFLVAHVNLLVGG